MTCLKGAYLRWKSTLPGSSMGPGALWVLKECLLGERMNERRQKLCLTWGLGYSLLACPPVQLSNQAPVGLHHSAMGTGGELALTIGTSPVSQGPLWSLPVLPPTDFAALCVSASQAASIPPTVCLPGLRCSLRMAWKCLADPWALYPPWGASHGNIRTEM